MTQRWKIAILSVFAAALSVSSLAQTPPVTILEIEINDVVWYLDDLANPDMKATSAAIAPRASSATRYRTFKTNLGLADIVSVNGKPATGFYVQQWTQVLAATNLTPGQAIADTAGSCPGFGTFAILQPDGTPIGTIMMGGIAGRPVPPGAPASATLNNQAVVGGTGVFLGARGQAMSGATLTAVRPASMLEDPAYRRINGGGRRIEIIHLIPMFWPEVLALPTGPAIYHGDDFSPVTASKPARAGELLIMCASGLGPVKAKLDPGKPFPAFEEGKLLEVNSPVSVTVEGLDAPVLNKVGWPGMTNAYRVDFRVPDGTPAGMAAVGITMAWINGMPVQIPVR